MARASLDLRCESSPPGRTSGGISIIVPTRDGACYLEQLIPHLRHACRRSGAEVLFLDHRTKEPRALRLLEEVATFARVLPVTGDFNFSAMMNHGAAETSGPLILFLNNDVEPLDDLWLDHLAASIATGASACGSLLLYPDRRTVQHAGMALGLGYGAGHLHRGCNVDSLPSVPGPLLPREVSALSGACLLVRRRDFEAVGGFDERLALSFNDVDLCLRLQSRGGSVLYEPASRLVHHETVTRSPRLDPREVEWFRRRWGRRLDDPFLSPAICRFTESTDLDLWSDLRPSRRRAPWTRIAPDDGTG
ncbi:MAG TPA: glycosyltransferase [bacterium]|nr:glycosyltransferase [bacterium]